MNPTEINTGDDRLGEIVDELLSKMARGEAVDVEHYAKQHPDAADVLRHAIPALQAIAMSNTSGDGGAATDVNTGAGNLADDFASGRTLGDFRLVGELGRGGMGVVYEADEISLGRKVALKVLPFAGIVDDRALHRFRNEVRAAAALDHPNIVSVHSAGEQRGVHYYAMQLVRGQTLAEVIRQLSQLKDGDVTLSGDSISRLVSVPAADSASSGTEPTEALEQPAGLSLAEETEPLRQHQQQTLVTGTGGQDLHFYRSVAILGVQAASALQHAHDNGVLHRDIKPGNLMLDAQSQLYITDFGLARIESDAAMTMTGDLIGTLRYMSPEQALAKRVVIDQRSDIYSLGATFYELLALKPVFNGAGRHELLKQIAFEEPIKLRKVDRAIPTDLETIIHKSLAKNPNERYSTAEEFAADLQAFIHHRPIAARPPTPLQRLGKWSQRNQGLVASAVVATGICLVLLIVSNILVARQKALAVKAAANESTQRQIAERERDAAQQAKSKAEDVSRFLIDAFRSPDPEQDGYSVTVVEVLDQAVKELESRENIGPVRRANLLSALGETYGGLELGREAVPLLEKVLKLRQNHQGEKHVDTLAAMNNLAVAYNLAGRMQDALELNENTLENQREVLGERHRDTLKTMTHLASSLKELGRIAEAIELHEETLKLKHEVLGEKDPQTPYSMHGLALAYENAGRFNEALELMKEAYEVRRKVLGERDPLTLNSMGMLGMLFLSAGEPMKAAEILEQSVKLTREVLGEQHPRILVEENNLAVAYSALGRYEDALGIHEEILAIRRERSGQRHPKTLTSMINLALEYARAQRHQDALKLAKETVELCREIHGERHPDTLHAMNALANAYLNLRHYPEVVELCETLLKLRREELGEQHPDTLTSMSNLAFVYGAVGQVQKAIELSQQAVRLHRTKLGERHPNTLTTMTKLARYHEQAGQYSEAISLNQSTLDLTREVLGKRHPNAIYLTKQLADCYKSLDRFKESIELYEKAFTLAREVLGPWHRTTLGLMTHRAGIYRSAGRYAEASNRFDEAIKFLENPHDDVDLDRDQIDISYSTALNGAAETSLRMKQPDKAEATALKAFELRRRLLPDHWSRFYVQTILGEALVQQEKIDEAEQHLLEGFAGMDSRKDSMSKKSKERIAETCQLLVELYRSQDDAAQAEKWEQILAGLSRTNP